MRNLSRKIIMVNSETNNLQNKQKEPQNHKSTKTIVPILLAHHFTAISFEPGGRVLDVFAKQAMRGNNNG